MEICKEAEKPGASLGFTPQKYVPQSKFYEGPVFKVHSLNQHTGYIPRLLSDLYNVMGALEYESNSEGHGLKWALKARRIRQLLCFTLKLEGDEFMLQVIQNNIATDMLANGQPQEALPLLEAVYDYDMSKGGINADNFYRALNLSICHRLLGQYREAIKFSNMVMKVIQEHIGEDSVPMAT